MKNKKIILFALSFVLALTIIGNISSVCCEKTLDGFSCLNVENGNECDLSENLRSDRTSCEETTYCGVGTCIDNKEGLCFDSPQTTCNSEHNGFWDERAQEDVLQCREGCCILVEKTAFVTAVRCTWLAAQREGDVTPDFMNNVQNSAQCNELANPSEKGACIYESELGRKCTMETRTNCQSAGREFHGGFLCSAEELGTLCGSSDRTKCVEDKEEVYYVDSCGNIANIYDSTKRDDQNYWTYLKEWDESCDLDMGDASSVKSCGNCGYGTTGSVCGAYRRGEDENPNLGNFVCRDLSCEYGGEKYNHGEKWCVDPSDWEDYMPGQEEIRLICSNGEVNPEPCEPFRNELCLEVKLYDDGTSDGYRHAECVLNKWQECPSQKNQKDCEIEDLDCEWLSGETYRVFNKEEKGMCVPKYAPGFNFWDAYQDTQIPCQLLTLTCDVTYEKKWGTDWEVVGSKTCLADGGGGSKLGSPKIRDSWAEDMQDLCYSMGDCGVKTNYLKVDGYNYWEELFSGDYRKSSLPNRKSHGGGISTWWKNSNREAYDDDYYDDCYDNQGEFVC